jgi:hypothetical protein
MMASTPMVNDTESTAAAHSPSCALRMTLSHAIPHRQAAAVSDPSANHPSTPTRRPRYQTTKPRYSHASQSGQCTSDNEHAGILLDQDCMTTYGWYTDMF